MFLSKSAMDRALQKYEIVRYLGFGHTKAADIGIINKVEGLFFTMRLIIL